MTQKASHAVSLALVERMFSAEFNFMKAGGIDQNILAEAFHPEVVVHEPRSLPYAGDWVGLGGVASLMRAMNHAWAEMAVDRLEVHGDGERVLLACQLRMVARRTDRIVRQPFAERLHFEDGKLIEGTPFYFDTADIAAALTPAISY
jgi:ketosteroid isomerase-like protein